ncbi:Uncharacterised protein [Mycobacterium tuberculosis]|nr:Uncharacterised protein [Mycobacterium tuberculosis]
MCPDSCPAEPVIVRWRVFSAVKADAVSDAVTPAGKRIVVC